MNIAVFKLFGKQHLVTDGSTIKVAADAGKQGDKITVEEVFLTSVDGETKVGTPVVEGAKVVLEVVSSGKGEKIHVMKFKAKSRYRRSTGFRPLESKLRVISLGESKAKEEKPEPKTKTVKVAKKSPAKK